MPTQGGNSVLFIMKDTCLAKKWLSVWVILLMHSVVSFFLVLVTLVQLCPHRYLFHSEGDP